MDKLETKLRADIERYGWHVLNVQPDAGHPPHSYSIGLFATFGHPEIVIAGLPGERAQQFINTIGGEIQDGAKFEAGCRYGHLIQGYDVMFVRVAPKLYAEDFGRAFDYYGSRSFSMLQMVWPDRNGAFPWDASCEASVRALQPVFSAKAP